MTPTEALAAATRAAFGGNFDHEADAEETLGHLPEGWELHGPGRCVDIYEHETATAMSHGDGVAEERKRLESILVNITGHASHLPVEPNAEWGPGIHYVGDGCVAAAKAAMSPKEETHD